MAGSSGPCAAVGVHVHVLKHGSALSSLTFVDELQDCIC